MCKYVYTCPLDLTQSGIHMKPDIRYTMLAVGDLLELIERANRMVQIEKKAQEPDELLLAQYRDLKNDYLQQLGNLLKDFDIQIQLPGNHAA